MLVYQRVCVYISKLQVDNYRKVLEWMDNKCPSSLKNIVESSKDLRV